MGTAEEVQYGLRYDPAQFVERDTSLQGALVRARVFERPQPGDRELIAARVAEVLAGQRPDGSFADTSKETGGVLLELIELGMAPDRPEVRQVARTMLRQVRAGQNANEWYEEGGVLNVYSLHALCLLGMADEPEVPHSLRALVDHQELWNDPWQGCPWTPAVFWPAAWAGRGTVPEVVGAVTDGMRRLAEQMNGAGCCAYNDPWGFVQAAGLIEGPEAAALLAKQVPMILRGQRADGGWGERSLYVFRALRKHGLLEQLRARPALPPDWKVASELPLPDGGWFSLAWDGRSFWSFDRGSRCAVALSPEDGRELRRIRAENCHAVAWWDGALATVGGKPKELRKLDADTGKVLEAVALDHMEDPIGPVAVADKVLVGDGFLCCVSILDGAEPHKHREQTLAGPGPMCMASDGNTVWHADFWAPAIIRSDLQGNLLEWGEKPFDVQGLAWDGRRLWALDAAARRLCAIERMETGGELEGLQRRDSVER